MERFKVGDFWLGFESIKGLFADKAKELVDDSRA